MCGGRFDLLSVDILYLECIEFIAGVCYLWDDESMTLTANLHLPYIVYCV